jgi:hypothetical protein
VAQKARDRLLTLRTQNTPDDDVLPGGIWNRDKEIDRVQNAHIRSESLEMIWSCLKYDWFSEDEAFMLYYLFPLGLYR